jgi:Fe-Mn family superoxide dismutase
MNDPASFRTLIEKVSAEQEVYYAKLPVAESALSPVFSKEAISLHYGTLYKNYVKKALDGEGEFQTAGARLHTLFFMQFQAPKNNNKPDGAVQSLIDSKFGSFDSFKSKVTEAALGIHGSGWVYLSTSGAIKTIPNHKITDNVALIIDIWEHSYVIDYGADKEKYLKEIWKIMDWDIVNVRLS